MIKRLAQMCELTVPEQKIVVVLLCVLIAVAALRYYRVASGGDSTSAHATAADQPSPSPGIRP